ncbi:type II toxin-antitoxin system MqsR family toxin [Pseudomonas lurida]|jgi:motility quorum-sensing regulator/GCU-specific mRNA interferase toxin|uniref:mRNA interferase toxin MqsR n=1 Tax=Pseudomonas fluorescens TaxID=294 RepID=A0A5E6MRT9_PSEFL|nr:type II toxin-antitoxin system MqsR family toxin [Pseudomonas lurida]VVM14552.1 mRNA interferase toxin MqsR [Pseudomonas fluorescens]MBC3922163.1 type II toxin-antitoxin system MqsR family toxin [Pseudomonas lurida]PFG22357.1 motility quorum-sensing regulator/GCU-specific mRNA interferase toxin [Pseudomonas lurida]WLG29554.1 type II toxin-antitoxin system MqsR family toxin [Pseudomonas lurida]VVM91720.1 mRNA interferase toxin MqsR [Pseudomonas fluorescens]
MEKYTPHYDLAVIKLDVRRLGRRAFTHTAQRCGRELHFSIGEMQEAIYGLQHWMLYKSMTTYSDHRVWQDVYCTHSKERDIYIKVTYSPDSAPPVISFKEKNP